MNAHDREGRRFRQTATLSLGALLFAAYVGAYLWMVNPVLRTANFDPDVVPVYRWSLSGNVVRQHNLWSAIFTPIHGLDRRIRPKKWDPNSYTFTVLPK